MPGKYLSVSLAPFCNCLPVGMSHYKNTRDGFCYKRSLFVGNVLAEFHPWKLLVWTGVLHTSQCRAVSSQVSGFWLFVYARSQEHVNNRFPHSFIAQLILCNIDLQKKQIWLMVHALVECFGSVLLLWAFLSLINLSFLSTDMMWCKENCFVLQQERM